MVLPRMKVKVFEQTDKSRGWAKNVTTQVPQWEHLVLLNNLSLFFKAILPIPHSNYLNKPFYFAKTLFAFNEKKIIKSEGI